MKNLILTTPVPVDFKRQKQFFLGNVSHNCTALFEIACIVYAAFNTRESVL